MAPGSLRPCVSAQQDFAESCTEDPVRTAIGAFAKGAGRAYTVLSQTPEP